MLVGRPFDKNGLPVGLYNPVFDEFKARLSDLTSEVDITLEHIISTSSFCIAAADIYCNQTERCQAMEDIIEDILDARITAVPAFYTPYTSGTIKTNAHDLSLYRAILEWKNDMGGDCDVVKRGYFSYRKYWIQKDVRKSCSSFT